MYLDTNNEIHTRLQVGCNAHLAKRKYLQSSGVLDVVNTELFYAVFASDTQDIITTVIIAGKSELLSVCRSVAGAG